MLLQSSITTADTSAGDVFVKGAKVKTGLQPYTKGDDIGFKV